ncbi:MAG: sensor histidine kinase [Planctomycetota bacterium]|jgi:signal transduction histidine kinase
MSITEARGLEDLREVIEAYNGLAERLTESQRALESQVTELRGELVEKNALLARKNRLEILGEMAAGVAHEIRNPLGGIRLYAGLIAREAVESPKISRWATRINEATRDLSRIVGEILDFTRPIAPQLRPVLLSRAADAALELACAELDKRGVTTRRVLRQEEKSVPGDFNLLQRAFLNVILNAAEAMTDGGTLEICLAGATLGERPAQSIAFLDEGAGIDAGDISRIFDPFFTRKERGTGLGLAMVSRIVAAHSGSVSASSAGDGGAVFKIALPVETDGEEGDDVGARGCS